jgi:hypothetical protein
MGAELVKRSTVWGEVSASWGRLLQLHERVKKAAYVFSGLLGFVGGFFVFGWPAGVLAAVAIPAVLVATTSTMAVKRLVEDKNALVDATAPQLVMERAVVASRYIGNQPATMILADVANRPAANPGKAAENVTAEVTVGDLVVRGHWMGKGAAAITIPATAAATALDLIGKVRNNAWAYVFNEHGLESHHKIDGKEFDVVVAVKGENTEWVRETYRVAHDGPGSDLRLL